jgi:methylated-DNA-[protein]-cysteine S-methyltransferase
MKTWFARLDTPIGGLTMVKRGDALCGVHLDTQADRPRSDAWIEDGRALAIEARQLEEYFAGERVRFDLPIETVGTPFQAAVWQALLNIPHGATTTYASIARTIARPRAVRAVGAANAHNPIGIIVPCHRVIGSTGALVGYAGGLAAKKWLLAHERDHRRRYALMIGTPSCVST